jgi:radical SAM protein with 4Fe4S-binding SPASM domain
MKKDIYSFYAKAVKALTTRTFIFENDGIPVKLQNLSYKKIFNAIRVGMSVYAKPEKPWGYPITLQLEPSSLCNLRCTLCPVTYGLDRSSGLMNLKIFKEIIDTIGDYLFMIVMFNWGEPFVNPAIYDMIAYAKKNNIGVISSSNAHAFAKKENADKLIESGIDVIAVAIDGIKQETYERFRDTGCLETALEGVRNLVAAKHAMSSKIPLINLRFIPMKHNEHEIPELKRLANTLDVDVLSIKTLNPYGCYSDEISEDPAYYDKSLTKNERYHRFKYDGNTTNRHRISRKPPCIKLWDCMTICWNGDVCLCAFDYKNRFLIGNIVTDSIQNVWNSSNLRSMRRQFRKDYKKIQLCKNCTYSFVGGSLDGEIIREIYYNQTAADSFLGPENPEKVHPL